MTEGRTYGPARDDADLVACGRHVAMAFATTPDGGEKWLRKAGQEHVRVAREGDGPPAATLLRIPMGQFFGGRSVPMVGVAGVAVAPEWRRRGVARFLMREAVREMAREGAALSALYASTQALYRQVGYEQGGHAFRARLPLALLDVREPSLPVRALGESDAPAVERCYRAFASRFDGPLDRGEYVWRRVRAKLDDPYFGFGVPAGEDGELEGYVYLRQERGEGHDPAELVVSDVAFTTPRAGRRLAALLADFGTIAENATLQIGPVHPLLTLLPMQRYDVERREYWMLRVVDVARALEARGYPRRVAAEVTIAVRDDVVPENDGVFTLRVEDGRGAVTRGGTPAIRAGVGGLAAVYAGLYSPRQAALAGLVEGDDEALAAAGEVFAPSAPWMADFF